MCGQRKDTMWQAYSGQNLQNLACRIIYMHVEMHSGIYWNIDVSHVIYIYIYIYTHTHTHTHTHIYIHTHIHTRTHACIHTHMYAVFTVLFLKKIDFKVLF